MVKNLLLALFIFTLIFLSGESFGQTQTITSPGFDTFTVPTGVTSITVEVWGAGGRGGSWSGNGPSNQGNGGGGGGGAYSRSLISVTPGQSLSLFVGAGASSTSAGQDSYFINASTLMAKGGASSGANSATGASGGSAGAGFGAIKYSGGNGVNASASFGGGGGSSAGTAQNGVNAINQSGATAPTGGGNGGNGRDSSAGDGTAGSNPGGGGGGAFKDSNTNRDGGTGANGQIRITWTCSTTLTSAGGSNNQAVCLGTSIGNIAYTLVGATGASVSGLPAGVSFNYINGSLTISGTPTSSGIFNYTVTPTGSCSGTTANGTISVNSSTVITSQSTATQIRCVGVAFSPISITATGTGTLSYQWYSNASASNTGGSIISGATSASYTPPSSTVGTLYYYAVATGTCNSVTSAVSGAFTVTPATLITSQSTATQTRCVGVAFSPISITATGTGTLSYQWYSNASASNTGGSIISGASSASYTPPSSTVGTLYYYAVATGTCNSVTSAVSGAFTVTPATVITSQSTATQTRCVGVAFSPISITATGTGTLTYQWYSNASASNTGGSIISGATSASYTPPSSTVGTLYYYAVATGTCNSVTSAVSGAFTVTPATVITSQSTATQTRCVGVAFSPISITATGTGTLTYQWYSNASASNTGGSIISGATSASYTPPSSTVGTLYYYAVATGTCNSVTSAVSGAFTVTPATVITSQSTATQTRCVGVAFSPISITATGTGTLSYQWYSNASASNTGGSIISGATSASYTPPSSTVGTLYYYAVATGTCNSVTSAVSGAFTVTPATVITSQSTATQTRCVGVAFSPISITATGTGTLSYQWYSNASASNTGGSIISGATSASYTPPSSTVGTLYYYAVATGTCNSVTSAVSGAFTVTPATVITSQSTATQTRCVGVAFSPISITATGTGTLSYQWYSNASASNTGGSIISGATSASYTPPSSTVGTLYYYAVATGTCNSVTSAVSGAFTVTPATVITSQSTATQTRCVGVAFSPISITATGTGTLSYQWYSNASASNTGGSIISGATSASYTPPSSTVGTLYYYAVATGTCNSVTSAVSGAYSVEPNTVIVSHPDPSTQNVCLGDGFNPISVSAVGSGLSFQWFRNSSNSNSGGISIPGAISSSYTPPSTSQGSTYYYVIVSGNCGIQTSNISGEFIVNPANTSITLNPSSSPQTTCVNAGFSPISISADGVGTITYQWYRNSSNSNTGGTLISGANSPSFTPPASAVGINYYYATAKSDCGTVTTTVSGAFTVTQSTAIDSESLASQVVCIDDSFTPISVTASGTGELTYQWYSNTINNTSTGAAISGATSSSFTPTSSVAGTNYYYVIVGSNCGANLTSNISGAFTVNPLPTPTFVTAPTAAVCVGSSVTYTTQSGQTNYVWSGFGNAGTDYTITGGGIGSTNNSVTINWLTSGTKNISVHYTNSNNCTSSVPATNSLTVNTLPTPTFITSPSTAVCVGSSVTYTTESGSGQSNYIWTVPGTSGTDYNITGGGTGTSNPTVTLTWLTSGTKNVSVYYTNSNNCTASTSAENSLSVTPLPIPTFTSAPSSTSCLQSDITYTTQSGKSDYVWNIQGVQGTDYTISAGGTGSASGTVTLKWLTTGSKTVTVRYTEPSSGCIATSTATSTTMVEPFATVGPTSVAFPSVCISSPTLSPFSQPTTGVTGIGTPSGLPPGINATFNSSNGQITFSGTATTPGLFSYSIPLTGNCINGLTATGTIDVTPNYEITSVSSVSATTVGGSGTVTIYGDPSILTNGNYQITYQIKEGSGSFTQAGPTNISINSGKGSFSTIPINSTSETYTVQILTIKKSTDACTITLNGNPNNTTYFGVCSAVYAGNSTFFVPAGVYSITIEVYGGGGGGDNFGGGGGGYSTRREIPVIPGEPLAVFIGNGGNQGQNGGMTYVTRDSNIGNVTTTSLVYALGGNSGSTSNASGGTTDPRHTGNNGNNGGATTGGKAAGALGGNGGASGQNGSPPGGGGGRKSGQRGLGGTGLVIISYSCPDSDPTDCVKVIDDGSKSGLSIIQFICDVVWTAPEGLSLFTAYVGSAGGGGGSGEGSGGGGSGTLIQQTFTTNNPYGLPAGSNYLIEVGQGGQGASVSVPNSSGSDGNRTAFSGTIDGTPINIVVPGGGGGGSRTANNGRNGASGGGGSATPDPAKTFAPGGNAIPITYSGLYATVYQGNQGGSGDYSSPQNSVAGGGGGGLTPWKSGNDGQNGKAAGNGQGEGGRGGDGIVLNLGDSLRYFGAGGGGIGRYFNGTDKIGIGGSAGGVKIGGDGNLSGTQPVGTPGAAHTGSGGGSGYYAGGKGGNGVVYITFLNFRILKVEYNYFNAKFNPHMRSGELSWSTSKEWENSHFEIERSINGINSWSKIGEFEGKGYSETPSEYKFNDSKLPASGGIIYYRLKQVDFDGKEAYSATKSIKVEALHGNGSWVAYPNPSSKKSTVTLELLNRSVYNDEPILIRISDIKGVSETFLVNQTQSVSEVVNAYLNRSISGMYILQIIWGSKSQQLKLIRE